MTPYVYTYIANTMTVLFQISGEVRDLYKQSKSVFTIENTEETFQTRVYPPFLKL